MRKNFDSIITYVDYGHIRYNIKTLMKKRNLSKSQMVKRTGLHHQVIERYTNDDITRFDRDILAKICYILDCKLEDIMTYIPPTENDKKDL